MICHRVIVCPQDVETADTHRRLRRMQSPSDPADRTGTFGVEGFDATYGAGFQASDDSPHAVECEVVEDGGAFGARRPPDADRPRRVAFVDGTMRTEARLTRTGTAIFTAGRPVPLPDPPRRLVMRAVRGRRHRGRSGASAAPAPDGRGTVEPLRDGTPSMAATCGSATPGRGRVPGQASPALRCRQASAVPPRSRRPTKPRASRRCCTGTRGPR